MKVHKNWNEVTFRPLLEDECRILFLRHFDHKGNITPEEECERARKQGKMLAEKGLEISAGFASPQPRSYIAVYETLRGAGKMAEIRTDEELDSWTSEGLEAMEELKKKAQEFKIEPEAFLFDPRAGKEIKQAMIIRNEEGTDFLYTIALEYPKETIIAGSHGGSRMEISILGLKRGFTDLNPEIDDLPLPEIFLKKGQIVELIFNNELRLVEENYLPIIA